MKVRAYLRTLGRYFSNNTYPERFIADPFINIIKEENGERVSQKKVGFQELFYDLFVVAVLTVYTRESSLSDGNAIGSYVLFFSAIWTIWASQTVFDVRYGTKDGMIWIFGYLQLCVYGAWAAISGDFDLSFGLTKEYHEQEELELHNIMHHYFRPENFVESPAATRRSFKVASGVFAASRVVLLCQYLIVLYFARKQRRPCRPIYYNMLGCTLSGLCWFAAVGLSYYDAEAFAISRIVLWALGLVVELAGMIMAAVVQPSINLDLEYWAERFSALTLIVLGEGIVGLFESFQKVLHGIYHSAGRSIVGGIAGNIITIIAFYRLLYYLYFDQHSHHIRGGPLLHGLWGAIHFPMHLALLLLTQCLIHNFLAMNLFAGIIAMENAWYRLTVQLFDQPTEAFQNTTAWAQIMLYSAPGKELQTVISNFGMSWPSEVGNMVTTAAGNSSTLERLYITEQFTLLQRLFMNNDFDPPEASNVLADEAANLVNMRDWAGFEEVFNRYVNVLIKPVFVSQQYGVTVLGGFFICLAALLLLQHYPHHHRHRRYWAVSCWYKFGLGTVLLLLSLLNIGPFFSIDGLFDEAHSAPMYDWIFSVMYQPSLFLAAATSALLDFGIFIYRKTQEDELASKGGQAADTPPIEGLPVLRLTSESEKEKGGDKYAKEPPARDASEGSE